SWAHPRTSRRGDARHHGSRGRGTATPAAPAARDAGDSRRTRRSAMWPSRVRALRVARQDAEDVRRALARDLQRAGARLGHRRPRRVAERSSYARARSASESNISVIPCTGWLKSTKGGKILAHCSLNQTSNGDVEAAKRTLASFGSAPSR